MPHACEGLGYLGPKKMVTRKSGTYAKTLRAFVHHIRLFYDGLEFTLKICVDGDDGLHGGNCANRGESQPLNDKTKSLVLVNYFMTAPIKLPTCELNSKPLVDMLGTCYGAAGNRWANFVAVNFYKV